MLDNPVHFDVEQAQDSDAIQKMHERTFGPGRFVRTVCRLRENGQRDHDLCFVARIGSNLVGSTRLVPILIDSTLVLLFGPLTVEFAFRGQGIGMNLLKTSLAAAAEKSYPLVILVGDEPYYSLAGFKRVPMGRLVLPGPVDPNRLLYKELVAGAFDHISGVVKAL